MDTVTLASDLLAELVGHYGWRNSAVVGVVVQEDVVRLVCHQSDRYGTGAVVSAAAHLIDEVASYLVDEQERSFEKVMDKDDLRYKHQDVLADNHRRKIWPLLINVKTLNHKPRTLALAMSGLHALASIARDRADTDMAKLHKTAVRFAYSAMKLHPASDWILTHASRLLRELVTAEDLELELRVLQVLITLLYCGVRASRNRDRHRAGWSGGKSACLASTPRRTGTTVSALRRAAPSHAVRGNAPRIWRTSGAHLAHIWHIWRTGRLWQMACLKSAAALCLCSVSGRTASRSGRGAATTGSRCGRRRR